MYLYDRNQKHKLSKLKDQWININNNNDRSSDTEVFFKRGALKTFAKFTGKYLCQRLFFDKDAASRLQL